jgi:hypothetical protein
MISPNPASNILYIGNLPDDNVIQISIIDMLSVQRMSLKPQHSPEMMKVDISSLNNGIYHVVVDNGFKKHVHRLVVSKE